MFGHRGSTIAKIVGSNVTKVDSLDDVVTMYVYEEIINGRKLTEIINEDHENVKYLPGHKIPSNVVRTFMISLLTLLLQMEKRNRISIQNYNVDILK